MCKSKGKESALRSCDLFGAPIGVTFNGEYQYTTGLGGFASICSITLILINLCMSLVVVFTGVYDQKVSRGYQLEWQNTSPYFIETLGVTIAGAVTEGQMQSLPKDRSVDQLFRIMFYQLQVTKTNEYEVRWVNSTRCDSFYASHIEEYHDESLKHEFTSEWVCPDVESLKVQNFPGLIQAQNGSAFHMVVLSCEDAKKIRETDAKNFFLKSINETADQDCLSFDDEETRKVAESISFQSKLLHHEPSSPNDYAKDADLLPIFSNRFQTFMKINEGQMHRTTASRNRFMNMKSYYWVNFIPFFSIFQPYIESLANQDYSLTTYGFYPYQNTLLTNEVVSGSGQLGYVNIAIGQSAEYSDFEWTKPTFSSVLASCVTQGVALLALSKLVIMVYQNYSYTKQALQTLYYERRIEDGEQPTEYGETSWKKDLKQKFDSRFPFRLNFCTIVFLYIAENVLCCLGKRCERTSLWYRRQSKRFTKFKIARQKLESEVDIVKIINVLRLSKFLAKLSATKRQRRSVSFFRKYTIEDAQLAREEELENMKEAQSAMLRSQIEQQEQQRANEEKALIIEGCRPDEDLTDRRILFEMTGRRLDPNEFPAEEETDEEFDVAVLLDELLGYDIDDDNEATSVVPSPNGNSPRDQISQLLSTQQRQSLISQQDDNCQPDYY